MSRLIPNSTPAERAVGCSFGETMESSAKVIANGGELFGTPTIDFGATLNGTTDYITYPGYNLKFENSTDNFTIVFWVKFTSAIGGDAIIDFRDGNDDGWTIRLLSNGSFIASLNAIAITSDSGFNDGIWHNVVIPFNRSGSTQIYIDGQPSGSAVSTTGVTLSIVLNSFRVGATAYDASAKFAGQLKRVKIFKSLLTEQDAINYYENSTYGYPNDALLHLPMRACVHDPDNTRTLDVSGNNTHGTLVGSPVKQQKRGYLFDGVDDAFTGLPALTGDYTVSLLADNEVTSYNTDTVYESLKTPGGFSGVVQNLMVTPYILPPLQEADNRIQMQKQVNHV